MKIAERELLVSTALVGSDSNLPIDFRPARRMGYYMRIN